MVTISSATLSLLSQITNNSTGTNSLSGSSDTGSYTPVQLDLGSVYGGGASPSAVTLYNQLKKTEAQQKTASDKSPQVKNAVAYFLSKIGTRAEVSLDTSITFRALKAGDEGDKIKVTLAAGTAAGTFKATVTDGVSTEVFDNIAGTGAAFYKNLVTAVNTGQGAGKPASKLVQALTAGGSTPPSARSFTLAGGTDGLTSVDALFKDVRLTNFVLSALGLGDQAQYYGLVKKALTQPLSDPKAVANQLPDKRFQKAAQILQLAESGLRTIQSKAVVDQLVSQFKSQAFEQSIADQNPAVSQARSFEKKAASITNVYQILADKTLRSVVSAVFNIPPQLAIQPITTQAAAISSRLDIKKLQDPKFVASFIQRFLASADQNQNQNLLL